MAAARRPWAAELLYFWFHQLPPSQWFRPGPEVDKSLARRFGPDLSALAQRPAHEFLSDPATARAAILLFDQVPRNIHRNTALAFANDRMARAIAHGALRRGWDRGLTAAERQFLAMPLMHSEHIADQQLSLTYFRKLGPRFGWPFARSHHAMIARFGRFPHRNELLERRSSAAEQAAVAAGNTW